MKSMKDRIYRKNCPHCLNPVEIIEEYYGDYPEDGFGIHFKKGHICSTDFWGFNNTIDIKNTIKRIDFMEKFEAGKKSRG